MAVLKVFKKIEAKIDQVADKLDALIAALRADGGFEVELTGELEDFVTRDELFDIPGMTEEIAQGVLDLLGVDAGESAKLPVIDGITQQPQGKWAPLPVGATVPGHPDSPKGRDETTTTNPVDGLTVGSKPADPATDATVDGTTTAPTEDDSTEEDYSFQYPTDLGDDDAQSALDQAARDADAPLTVEETPPNATTKRTRK